MLTDKRENEVAKYLYFCVEVVSSIHQLLKSFQSNYINTIIMGLLRWAAILL
jgi:hypothetical protein